MYCGPELQNCVARADTATSVEMCRESIGEEVGEEAGVQTMDDFASHEKDFVLYPVDDTEPLKCNQGSGIIKFSV